MISSPRKPQFTKSQYFENMYTHCLTNQVFISLIKMTCLKNLYVTNIKALNPTKVKGRTRMKSSIKV